VRQIRLSLLSSLLDADEIIDISPWEREREWLPSTIHAQHAALERPTACQHHVGQLLKPVSAHGGLLKLTGCAHAHKSKRCSFPGMLYNADQSRNVRRCKAQSFPGIPAQSHKGLTAGEAEYAG
jgi:hypothetical protein